MNKCFDKPWETSLEINTKLSLIGQHEFTDVMTRIAEVASQTKAKQTIYGRAAVIGSMGQITSDRLEGTIAANKTLFKGGASSWFTNEDGEIIFESSDGLSAMKLTGYGFCVANTKDEYGEWNWRTFGTGNGFSADELVTGFLSANVIEAGSITTDKVSSNFGEELDIASNRSIIMFATVDGERPAGALRTTDGYIEITAGKEASGQEPAVPAKIDIKSGGSLNLYGGGSVNIASSGKFLVDSTNFKIRENALDPSVNEVEVSGKITATSGKIAGFDIGSNQNIKYLYTGTSSMQSDADGIYLGTDGMNLGGKLKYWLYQEGAALDVKADSVTIGKYDDEQQQYVTSLVMDGYNNKIDLYGADIRLRATTSLTMQSGNTLNLLSGGNVVIGTVGQAIQSPFIIGATNTKAYIMQGKDSFDSNANGIYLGTDGINIGQSVGNYVKLTAAGGVEISGKITAASGQIGGWNIGENKLFYHEMVQDPDHPDDPEALIEDTTNYIALGVNPSSNYRIWAGSNVDSTAPFSVTKTGALKASRGSIGGWDLDDNMLYSGSGTNRITISSDPNSEYRLWAGAESAGSAKFWMKRTGEIKAISGKIGGWTINDGYLYGSKVGFKANTSADGNVAIWAGATYDNRGSASFRVTQGGALTATSASITGSISSSSISGGTIDGATITGGSLNIGNGACVINGSGQLTCNSVNLTGTINATGGTIGGWSVIGKNLLTAGHTFGLCGDKQNDGTTAIWIGSTLSANTPFRVTYDGTVYMKKLVCQNESGGTQTVDVTQINFKPATSVALSGATLGSKAHLYNTTYALYANIYLNNGKTYSNYYLGTYDFS